MYDCENNSSRSSNGVAREVPLAQARIRLKDPIGLLDPNSTLRIAMPLRKFTVCKIVRRKTSI